MTSFYVNIGQFNKALAYLKPQLDINRKLNYKHEEWRVLNSLASTYCFMEKYDLAISYAQEALNLISEIGDLKGELDTLHILGTSHGLQKSYKNGIEYLEKAINISQVIGSHVNDFMILSNLSYFNCCLQEYEQATNYIIKALILADKLNNLQIKGMAIVIYGNIFWQQKQYKQALIMVGKGLLILRPWEHANGKLILKKAIEEIFCKTSKKVIKLLLNFF